VRVAAAGAWAIRAAFRSIKAPSRVIQMALMAGPKGQRGSGTVKPRTSDTAWIRHIDAPMIPNAAKILAYSALCQSATATSKRPSPNREQRQIDRVNRVRHP
jgi:hypothetical protein